MQNVRNAPIDEQKLGIQLDDKALGPTVAIEYTAVAADSKQLKSQIS